MRVAKEQRRLERLFGAVILAVSGPAAYVACSSSPAPAGPGADSGIDAADTSVPGVDAPGETDVADVADAGVLEDVYVGPVDAGSCYAVTTEHEAGADAGPDA